MRDEEHERWKSMRDEEHERWKSMRDEEHERWNERKREREREKERERGRACLSSRHMGGLHRERNHLFSQSMSGSSC